MLIFKVLLFYFSPIENTDSQLEFRNHLVLEVDPYGPLGSFPNLCGDIIILHWLELTVYGIM